MVKKRKPKKRRSQADILVSTISKLPKHKAVSINEMAKRSESTWRTTKKNMVILQKAGIVKREKPRGVKRAKYKRA